MKTTRTCERVVFGLHGGLILAKRELITPKGDKRYLRRDTEGQFTSSHDDVGKSLPADRRKTASTIVPKGQGDRGDQKKKK